MKMIKQSTRQQRSNSLWHQLREKRLTASNFGAVLAAADCHLSDSLFASPGYKVCRCFLIHRTGTFVICRKFIRTRQLIYTSLRSRCPKIIIQYSITVSTQETQQFICTELYSMCCKKPRTVPISLACQTRITSTGNLHVHRVSKKTSKIVFVITSRNLHKL